MCDIFSLTKTRVTYFSVIYSVIHIICCIDGDGDDGGGADDDVTSS